MAKWESAPIVGADASVGWASAPIVQPSESADTSRNRARAVLQGGTLGFGDELVGALIAGLTTPPGEGYSDRFGSTYRDVRDAERAGQEAFRAERPGLSTGLELAGGLMTGGAAGARAATTKLARRIAAAPLRNRLMAASAGGGLGGAASGAGEAETLADMPAEAARAAVPGMLLGPAAELGATAVGRVAQALTPERSAERVVARGLDRSGLTPQEAGARVAAMGPGATLADVGEGATATLETLANQPGATRGAAARQLSARSRGQADEILEPFGPGRVIEMGRRLSDERRRVAGPLYERAFERGVDNTGDLRTILTDSPSVQAAWRRARAKGADDAVAEGITLDPRMLGTEAEPSLQGWQSITMQLNDAIESARRGANPRPSEVRRLTRIRDRINAAIDSQNPDYAQARNVWSGSKQFEEAMESGRSFLRDPSSVAIDDLSRMSDIDKAAYRVGVAQGLQDRIERMGETHDVTKIFRTPAMRAKMRALFDTPQEFTDFMNRVTASATKQRTMSQVLGNSATARRQAAQGEEELGQALAGAAADVVTGAPVQAVAGGGIRSLARRVPTSREATRDAAGQMLLETDPQRINRLLMLLDQGGTPYQRGTSGIGAPLALGVGGATLLPPGE